MAGIIHEVILNRECATIQLLCQSVRPLDNGRTLNFQFKFKVRPLSTRSVQSTMQSRVGVRDEQRSHSERMVSCIRPRWENTLIVYKYIMIMYVAFCSSFDPPCSRFQESR